MPTASARAARRFWRAVAAVTLAAYLVGSHWPKLRLPEVEGGPASDKLIHFVAFFLMALLAWWSGWFSRIRGLLAAGVLFALFDEITQELLPIERFFSLDDLVCDLAGLASSAAVLAATAPLGGWRARRESRLREAAENRLLAKPLNWANLAVAVALGVVVAVPLATMLAPIVRIDRGVMALIGAGIGGAIAGLLALEAGVQVSLRRLRERCGCLRCESDGVAPPACGVCGEAIPEGLWLERPRVPLAKVLECAAWPASRSAAAVVAVAGAAILLPAWGRLAGHFAPITILCLDLALLSLAFAWALHGARVRVARLLDRSGSRCLRCGHDLSGLGPMDASACIARCGECGTPFLLETAAPGLPPAERRETMAR